MTAAKTSAADVVVGLGLPDLCTGYVAGELTFDAGTADAVDVEDPAHGATIARVADADVDLVDRAVHTAADAFQGEWAALRPYQRGQAMQRVAQLLRANAELLATVESVDTGKPLRQARTDVETSARYFEFFAGLADKHYGQTIPTRSGELVYTVREPYGVVAHFTPWNSPLSQMSRGVAPSLAIGNTVVVKPSEVTPLSTLVVARLIAESGCLPPSVVNVVVGRGPTTGAAVLAHEQVHHVAFTGSVATGKAIMTAAAQRMVGCNLELGGKSPTIVLPDADLDKAAAAGAGAVIRNSGQSCFATTRMLVHRSVYDDFVERCVARMSKFSVGPGLDDPDLGPLSSQQQWRKVDGMVRQAVDEGARVAAGGPGVEVMPGSNGHYYSPTLLIDVDNRSQIATQEVFGPVQTVIGFDTVEEAVRLANDSQYGLAAGIFTNDLTRAHRIAARLEAGQVQVNRYPAGDVSTPFGGYKYSGIGREKGVEAMLHYSQLKTVIIDLPDDVDRP